MLIIFYGTSCVGKTTLMKYLCDHHGWKMISVYMTRAIRKGEKHKIQVSVDELIEGEARGDFLPLNQCYGNYYGTPIKELEMAERDAQHFWCLDFPIERRHLFDRYKHCGIVVLPKNKEQLMCQIQTSNRSERKTQILMEYEMHYQKIIDLELYCVINYPNEIAKTCREIQTIVEKYQE